MSEAIERPTQQFPGNPFRAWISGSDEQYFNHDPGPNPNPYYVLVYSSGVVAWSVVLFGQDEAHIRKVLVQAGEAMAEAERLYQSVNWTAPDWGLLGELASGNSDETYRLTINPLDMTQPIKVGWSSNC
jgi:hypothetical protein